MHITQKIRDSFARQTMMTTIGAEISAIQPGKVSIRVPISDGILQQHGFAHAAVCFAIGDSAAGYSALSVMPDQAEVLTAEMKINLLSPAAGDYLEATGHVIRNGKRLVVVSANVIAIDGDTRKEIAVLQGTMVPVFPDSEN